MRLLEPDLGEVADRLSILRLKIDAGMQKGVSTQGWEEEQKQLDAYLQRKIVDWQRLATSFSWDDFGKANAELAVVNLKLWQAEDEMRFYRDRSGQLTDPEMHAVAMLGLRIADLNDVRCRLVRDINVIFGAEGQEKIYGVSTVK